MVRPSLHLPRLQDMTTGPILLQLGESPSKPPETRAIIGLKASNQQIPISLSKPILVKANTFRSIKVEFTGLAKGTNLYLSRQYIGDVHTVEGVYKCSHKFRNHKMIFYMGFIH